MTDYLEITDEEFDTLDEMGEFDYDDYDDGQPDELTEWMDFDPDC